MYETAALSAANMGGLAENALRNQPCTSASPRITYNSRLFVALTNRDEIDVLDTNTGKLLYTLSTKLLRRIR